MANTKTSADFLNNPDTQKFDCGVNAATTNETLRAHSQPEAETRPTNVNEGQSR